MEDYLRDLARRIIEGNNLDAHVRAKSIRDRIELIQKIHSDNNPILIFDDISPNLKWFDKETLEIIEKYHDAQMKAKGAKFTRICFVSKTQNDEAVN